MERLSAVQVSNLMPQNITVNDIEIDLYAVNYDVRDDLFASRMETMLGPNVMLSSSSKRPYPSVIWNDYLTVLSLN